MEQKVAFCVVCQKEQLIAILQLTGTYTDMSDSSPFLYI